MQLFFDRTSIVTHEKKKKEKEQREATPQPHLIVIGFNLRLCL